MTRLGQGGLVAAATAVLLAFPASASSVPPAEFKGLSIFVPSLGGAGPLHPGRDLHWRGTTPLIPLLPPDALGWGSCLEAVPVLPLVEPDGGTADLATVTSLTAEGGYLVLDRRGGATLVEPVGRGWAVHWADGSRLDLPPR